MLEQSVGRGKSSCDTAQNEKEYETETVGVAICR